MIRNKLRRQGGFTLIEMLAAVLILALLSLLLCTGLNLAVSGYRTMIEMSESQVLLSSLVNVLSDELRYARDMETTVAGEMYYTSASYGRYTVLTVKSGQLMANGKRVLAAGAYGNGAYQISEFSYDYQQEDGTFAVHLKVVGADNTTAETDLSIQCLNADNGTGR
jgi:prepilin-type N-terminal cleavage/methylation domain-containing protein